MSSTPPVGISRRRLLQRGAALGLAVPFGGALLSACGQSTQGGSSGGSNASTDPFTSAKIDWKSQKGTTLVLGAEQHPWITAITPYLGQFEKLTGIKVQTQVSGESQYVAKMPVTLAGGSQTPDVYMVWGYGQAVSSEWLEPLDSYLADTSLTDPAWYDEQDVFGTARDFVRWQGKTTYGLPITAEVQTTFYRSDVVQDAAGLSTFDGLRSAAEAAAKSGKVPAGIALRGQPTADAIAWPAAGYVFTNGGYLIDPDGHAALNSPQTIAGVQAYADLVKAACPKGVSTWSWLEITNAMQQGQVAMLQDSSNASFDIRDANKSRYAKEIKAAAFPSVNGVSKPNIYHWIIGINSKSANKKAAWLFLQWATSKPGAAQIAAHGGTPPRVSAWQSDAFRQQFGPQIADVVLGSLQKADSKPMTLAWMNPKWPQVGDAFARAVNSCFTSGETAASALAKAQQIAQAALK